METFLFLKFFTPAICISRKRNGIRQSKQCSCSKMPFDYLRANKTRGLFHKSRPLALLRLKNTWGEALSSVDLLKITLLHIFFLYFHNGPIFFFLGGAGRGEIYGIIDVLIYWWLIFGILLYLYSVKEVSFWPKIL